MDTEKILKSICSAPYLFSENNPTADAIINAVSEITDDIRRDNSGNIICSIKKGTGRKFIMSAHMDKIGTVITGIDKKTGMLRISKAGGIDIRILPAARVKVMGRKIIKGCVCSTPPHLSKGDNNEAAGIDTLGIDCGMTYEEISKIVNIGDRAEYDEPFIKLHGTRFTSPYMDNSAGCTAIIKAAEKIKNTDIASSVDLIFTTREEVGHQGASAAAFASGADIALITDVSFGTAPGMTEENSSPLGSGVMICTAPILQKEISDKLKFTAEKNNIPFTVEVCSRRTSTDADVFVNAASGIKTGLCSIPLINMHTPAECADIRDIEAVSELFAEFIKGEL